MSPDAKFYVLETEADAAADIGLSWATSGLTVRLLRGRKMRTLRGLFDEFGAAMQFPPYFGENGNAFDECVADLSWLPPQSGYVLIVLEPHEVLLDGGNADDLAWFVDSLSRAQARWATPVELGEWWDRSAVAFHVVLQCGTGDLAMTRDRWTGAGAELVLLSLT